MHWTRGGWGLCGNTKGQLKRRYLTTLSHLVVLISNPQHIILFLFHHHYYHHHYTDRPGAFQVHCGGLQRRPSLDARNSFFNLMSSSKQHMQSAQCCWKTTQLLVQHDVNFNSKICRWWSLERGGPCSWIHWGNMKRRCSTVRTWRGKWVYQHIFKWKQSEL